MHRHPPSSGLGSNTSIQDAFNLAWKLDYADQGLGRTGLLGPTPTNAPRSARPSSREPTNRASTTAPSTRAFRTEGEAHPVAGGLAKLRDPSPGGVQAREDLIDAVEFKNTEFNAQGTELNQRYDSTAVVPDPERRRGAWQLDPGLHLQATTRPGAKSRTCGS